MVRGLVILRELEGPRGGRAWDAESRKNRADSVHSV